MVGNMLAKKKYGQNFLINEKIIKDIVNLLDNVKENDLIIEIGPGKGAITKYLIKMPCKIKCIEIDEDMHKYLDKYESDKCSIIYKDILQVNIPVVGENDEYTVTIKLEGIIAEIQKNIKNNKNQFEFRTIIQSLTKIFNTS